MLLIIEMIKNEAQLNFLKIPNFLIYSHFKLNNLETEWRPLKFENKIDMKMS